LKIVTSLAQTSHITTREYDYLTQEGHTRLWQHKIKQQRGRDHWQWNRLTEVANTTESRSHLFIIYIMQISSVRPLIQHGRTMSTSRRWPLSSLTRQHWSY